MNKILIYKPRGGLQCDYVTSTSDIVGIRVVLVLICIPLSLVNHAEHGKTGETWLGDYDDTDDVVPCVIAFCSLLLTVSGYLDVSPFICQ